MNGPLHLFEGYGIEIEYMIVDGDTFRVRPVADLLLRNRRGEVVNEWCHDRLCWSNELVQHVIELKTDGPAPLLAGLDELFHRHIGTINGLLAAHGCILMPGATHPFMDPLAETVLWERENREIYEAFNTIFDCRGHGWSNLQSMHVNLPFHGDDEFFRLHAAIRMVLPFIPALTAASPFQDGRDSGLLDCRMAHYGKNCAKIPSVTGLIVPEPVVDTADYQATILQPLYRSIAPYDPHGILQHEWLNARGAIARFERDTIEIRVIDSQECARADIAVAELVCRVIERYATNGREALSRMNGVPTELLHRQLQACIAVGERAALVDPALAAVLDVPATVSSAEDFWRSWADRVSPVETGQETLEVIFTEGTLATRIKNSCQPADADNLRRLCRDLCTCLAANKMYRSAPARSGRCLGQ